MEKATLLRLERLLRKFPEIWIHTVDDNGGAAKTFHHVDYRSGAEGRPKVRLVSHVSSDMCELITSLKNAAPELIAIARASLTPVKPEAGKGVREPKKNRKGSNV